MAPNMEQLIVCTSKLEKTEKNLKAQTCTLYYLIITHF